MACFRSPYRPPPPAARRDDGAKKHNFPRAVRSTGRRWHEVIGAIIFLILLIVDLSLGFAIIAGSGDRSLNNSVFGTMFTQRHALLRVVGYVAAAGYVWLGAMAVLGQGGMFITALLQPLSYCVAAGLSLHFLEYKNAMSIAVPLFVFAGFQMIGTCCKHKPVRAASKLLGRAAAFLTANLPGFLAGALCQLLVFALATLNLAFFLASHAYPDTPQWVKGFRTVNGIMMLWTMWTLRVVKTGIIAAVSGAWWWSDDKSRLRSDVGVCRSTLWAFGKSLGSHALGGVAIVLALALYNKIRPRGVWCL